MNEKIIEVCNLNFENVLTNISLEIFKADFVAILGPNGGGKTTFVKLLLNILKQNAGEIKFYEDLKNKIGYIPQSATTVDTVFPATVDEIIRTAFSNKRFFFGKLSLEEKNYLDFLMQNFQIIDLKSKLFVELSGGQKQRVLIVRALANKPKLLILDEPDIGLDTVSQTKFIEKLNIINKENKTTIIFVTHHLGIIEKYITKKFYINGVLN
jgi:zinc transport system ATP-binding protein